MKNIHILPTDKPSRLSKQLDNPLVLYKQFIENRKFGRWSINQNIYITNDEEIKEDNWGLSKLNEVLLFGRSYNEKFYKKIILTTDQDLIVNGVQAIDDEFLEWFVKNPSCEFVEVENEKVHVGWEPDYSYDHLGIDGSKNVYHNFYKIIIPQEEPKQETIEEASERTYSDKLYPMYGGLRRDAFIKGAKCQQEKICDSEVIQRIKASKSDAEARRIIKTI